MNEAAIPIRIVIEIDIGSLPGITRRPSAPTTKPVSRSPIR